MHVIRDHGAASIFAILGVNKCMGLKMPARSMVEGDFRCRKPSGNGLKARGGSRAFRIIGGCRPLAKRGSSSPVYDRGNLYCKIS